MGKDRIVNDRYSFPDIRNGLILEWDCGIKLATPVVDQIKGNNGAIAGASRVLDSDLGRNILSFDGIDDIVESASTPLGEESSSIVFLMKRDTDNPSLARVVSPVYGANDSNRSGAFQFRNTTKLEYNIVSKLTLGNYAARTTSDIPIGKWALIIGTYNIVTGDVKIYFNTELEATGNNPNHDIKVSILSFNVGSTAFKGLVDMVRIYNRVLSLNEIKHLYKYIHRQYGLLEGFND